LEAQPYGFPREKCYADAGLSINIIMRGRLVGGGRSVNFPTLGKAEISLNIDPGASPDVLGDIASAPFKSASFDEVCFERVPFPSFTGLNIDALSESARLLHWGGQLVLETGIAAPVDDIVARLRAVGFVGIDVARLGLLRFTAVLGGP
jgi:hypothetical protein